LTQPPTQISTKIISLGKGSWWIALTTLPLTCANCLETW